MTVLLAGLGSTTTWGLLLDPSHTAEARQTPASWQVQAAHGQVPQQDYTALTLASGHDILTGGPLAYGLPLSGITDITGPDWADIAAFLDSRPGLHALPTTVARFVHHLRPPFAAGARPPGYAPDMVDLRPQSLWLLPRSGAAGVGYTSLRRAALPEPGTFGLLFFGGVLFSHVRRAGRWPDRA
jgi:hypothetical protein